MILGIWQVLSIHVERLRATYFSAIAALVVFVIAVGFSIGPSRYFSQPESVTIPDGTSISGAATILKERGYIRSRKVFRLITIVSHTDAIQAGTYTVYWPTNAYALVARLSSGDTGETRYRITFVEGTTVRDMARLLTATVPAFDASSFLHLALPKEGHLFPDTYYITEEMTPEDIVALLEHTFTEHGDWQRYLTEEQSVDETVIMASILEGEARTLEEKRIIAGILYKRLSIGMALQVDATFGYERDVRGYVPTAADLKEDTPYNTYRNRGLPPTAINNPGYESLLAAVTPIDTPYLYYLTGTDGTMHYSATFEQHVANKRAYLK